MKRLIFNTKIHIFKKDDIIEAEKFRFSMYKGT